MYFVPLKKFIARSLRFFLVFNKRLKFWLSGKYFASFPQEILENIYIPRHLALTDMALQLSIRSNHEVLLRILASKILRSCDYVGPQSIIDIGAWIGDNSLVWAKLIQGFKDWRVVAIDPSPRNVSFITQIAAFNSLSNIDVFQCLCSSSAGSLFTLGDGDINHGSFKEGSALSASVVSSTTLDSVYNAYADKYNLLLIHLDVEGAEFEVLRGSFQLLQMFSPIIIYEGHIKGDSDTLSAIQSVLVERRYTIWMINEVLPGCDLDCRNFLAIPPTQSDLVDELQLSFLEAIQHPSFFPATADHAALLRVC